jgi:hypothetical protein
VRNHRDRRLVTRSGAPSFVEASRLLLGVGSLFFAVWGLADPDGLARAMGDDPENARALGVRDGLIGAALLASRGPAPLTARIAADVADAVRLRSSSPKVAAGAAAFAAWGVAALALSARHRS